jgi:hypothetical protein
MVEYGSIINLLRSATYPTGAITQDWRKLKRLELLHTTIHYKRSVSAFLPTLMKRMDKNYHNGFYDLFDTKFIGS